jgi:hypothetical protein
MPNVDVDFESFFRTTFVRLTLFVIRLGATALKTRRFSLFWVDLTRRFRWCS